jgi:hypothetical protein
MCRYAEDCFTIITIKESCAQCHLVKIVTRLITHGVIMPSVRVLNVVSTTGRLCKLWPVLLKYFDPHVTIVMSDTCAINDLYQLNCFVQLGFS